MEAPKLILYDIYQSVISQNVNTFKSDGSLLHAVNFVWKTSFPKAKSNNDLADQEEPTGAELQGERRQPQRVSAVVLDKDVEDVLARHEPLEGVERQPRVAADDVAAHVHVRVRRVVRVAKVLVGRARSVLRKFCGHH